MSTVEIALSGLATVFVLRLAIARLRSRRLLPALSWGVIVASVTVVYSALAPALGPRQAVGLALSLVWGIHQTYWLHWLHFGGPLLGTVQRPSLLKDVALLFFCSAPMLAIMADPAPTWSIADPIGLVVFGIGAAFSHGGFQQLRRNMASAGGAGQELQSGFLSVTRQPHFFGESLMIWSFYLFALSTPSGPLTLFAPLLLTRYVREALAGFDPEVASPYGFSVTPDP